MVDLSHQLRLLLKEHLRRTHGSVPESTPGGPFRGGALEAVSPLVPPARLADDLDAVGAMDPDDVISENLVTFRDIVELQTRNTQLLRVVRQLSKQREQDLVGRQAEMESMAAAGLQVRYHVRVREHVSSRCGSVCLVCGCAFLVVVMRRGNSCPVPCCCCHL